jgi:hypothetical protein
MGHWQVSPTIIKHLLGKVHHITQQSSPFCVCCCMCAHCVQLHMSGSKEDTLACSCICVGICPRSASERKTREHTVCAAACVQAHARSPMLKADTLCVPLHVCKTCTRTVCGQVESGGHLSRHWRRRVPCHRTAAACAQQQRKRMPVLRARGEWTRNVLRCTQSH